MKKPKEDHSKEFPFTIKDIKDEGIEIHKCRIPEFIKSFPPDMCDGRGPRWKEIKDIIPKAIEQFALTGAGVKSLRITPRYAHALQVHIHYRGTRKECESLIAGLMAQWRSLPRDKEIETLVRRMFPKYNA